MTDHRTPKKPPKLDSKIGKAWVHFVDTYGMPTNQVYPLGQAKGIKLGTMLCQRQKFKRYVINHRECIVSQAAFMQKNAMKEEFKYKVAKAKYEHLMNSDRYGR